MLESLRFGLSAVWITIPLLLCGCCKGKEDSRPIEERCDIMIDAMCDYGARCENVPAGMCKKIAKCDDDLKSTVTRVKDLDKCAKAFREQECGKSGDPPGCEKSLF